jgi:hypothetical protein
MRERRMRRILKRLVADVEALIWTVTAGPERV